MSIIPDRMDKKTRQNRSRIDRLFDMHGISERIAFSPDQCVKSGRGLLGERDPCLFSG